MTNIATYRFQIKHPHRQIGQILNACPAPSWSLEESDAVLHALAGIVWGRQGRA